MVSDADDRARSPRQRALPVLQEALTLPNLLSATRLAGAVAFLLLAGLMRQFVGGAVLAAAAGATDFLDGYLARRTGRVTELGKALDPVADRCLILAVLAVVVWHRLVPVPLLVALGTREVLMTIVVLLLALLGAPRIDVVFVGKAGTLLAFVALPCFVVSAHPGRPAAPWQEVLGDVGTSLAVPAAVALWSATVIYAPKAIQGVRGSLAKGRRP